MLVTLLQARHSSSRLPGKVLLPILGRPMLYRQVERICQAKQAGRLVVATSTQADDDAIANLCSEMAVACFRGSLTDVLDRFYQAAKFYAAEHIVRVTGDCPLLDPQLLDQVVAHHLNTEADYTTNALEPTYPDGLDVEVIRFTALQAAWQEATLPSEREHVTPFIHRNAERFKISQLKNAIPLAHLRWTVDEAEDFHLVSQIYAQLYPEDPTFTTEKILALLAEQPQLATLNLQYMRNAGLKKSLQLDQAFLQGKADVTSI